MPSSISAASPIPSLVVPIAAASPIPSLASSIAAAFVPAVLVPAALAALVLACALLAGCSTPLGNVEEAEAALHAVNAVDVAAQQNPERREITWPEAVRRMEARNPQLREARASIINADAQIERVWLDLLPVTSLSYSIERALEDLVKGGGHGNGTLSVFGFVNIPGVVSLRMRFYGAVLSKIRVEHAYALAVREQHIALWKIFRDHARWRERKSWAGYTRQLANFGMDFTGAALDAYLSDYALEREEQSLQTRLGQTFGDLRHRWVPKGAAPPVDYSKADFNFADPARHGLLHLRLSACELEGARLRVLGAHLAFWPDIGAGLSSPPIYQLQADGTAGRWNWKTVSAYANLNWQADTRLSSLYNLAETKRQVALMRDRLALGNQQRVRSLLDAKRALEAQARQAAVVERRLAILRTATAPVSMEQFSAFATELRSLIEQRAALSAERDALNALFWMQDEARWPRPDPEALRDSDRAVDAESEARFSGNAETTANAAALSASSVGTVHGVENATATAAHTHGRDARATATPAATPAATPTANSRR